MKKEVIKNFILLEGLDGSGTTTQSKLLQERIEGSILTNEPTPSKIGVMIRKALQKKLSFDPVTLAYLFSADRNEHLFGKDGIVEKCKAGHVVICDRYLFSSLAYQSLGMPFEEVLRLNITFPLPEVTFYLNVDPSVCMNRIGGRGESKELFETLELQEKVHNNYLKSFSYYYEHFNYSAVYLDGNLSIDALLNEEMEYLDKAGILSRK